MADSPAPAAAPVASGGRPASLANTFSNGTVGRIKTLICTRDDPSGRGESFESQRLRELSQRYAEHARGAAPVPPEVSLWLRSEIDRLSQIVSPGQTSMWPAYSPAEKAYLAQQEAVRRRTANDIGIAVGGPVFSALPAAGRVFGASEQTVEDLGRVNAEIAGAAGLGRAGRGIDPVRSPTWRSPGQGTVIQRRPKPAPNGFSERNPAAYRTNGIEEHPEKSEQGRRLIDEYKRQGMSHEDAIKKAAGLMRTGSTLPDAVNIKAGETLYKVIPEGGIVGPKSEFWATADEVKALEGRTYDGIAGRTGIPLESQQTPRFEVVEITATRNTTVFRSEIAHTTQNGWPQNGGGTQILVTDRGAFSNPKPTGKKLP